MSAINSCYKLYKIIVLARVYIKIITEYRVVGYTRLIKCVCFIKIAQIPATTVKQQ